MLVVVGYVFHRPLHPALEHGLADRTLPFLTDFTRKIKAAISMDKKLNTATKIIIDQLVEFINPGVGFVHIQVPGKC